MELRHLRYFLAVAETGSFTLAAERLRISQPTLSHQIRQLEDLLGAPLFDRTPKRLRLTSSGEAFKPHCERALREAEAGVLAVSELQGLVRGALRIGLFHSFSTSRLGAVFADFATRYSGVHVVAILQPRDQMERGLLEGKLDLAVSYASEDTEHIAAERLFDEDLVLVVGSRHPFTRRRHCVMRALGDLPLVLLTPEFGARQFLDRFFAQAGIRPSIVLEMNAVEPILATVRHSSLVTVLPAGAAAEAKGVRAVRLTSPVPQRAVAILWAANAHRSAAARKMAEMIRAAYRTE
jgi:LysR family transcriptional regulator, cyn operon transcriptional activator